jgi:hypothetical protein
VTQFYIQKYLGKTIYGLFGKPYEYFTDTVYNTLT